ncbi:MAG: energy transducer TonB [Candidatus Omnitrophica bacterium]|nr:energy transducer TonB [Candidatus Omnitrophota bacterium]
MSHRLVKSTLFSMAVHALLLVPMGPLDGGMTGPRTDVVQGLSSVELVLVKEYNKREGPAKAAVIMREKVWADDGGAFSRSRSSSLRNPAPRYPWLARIHGWQGRVIVQAAVTTVGRVRFLRVAKSSGYPVLDQAALEAIREWKFIPARRGDRQLASRVEIPVTFQLNGE